MLIPIKPLSVNRAFKGKKFRTKEYDQFERDLMILLPKIEVDCTKKISLSMDVGVCGQFDIDNCAKTFIDVLQKKYGFNDRNIEQLHMYKNIVRKGHEFVNFKITYLEDEI